jgi:2-polyprenyl-3-methyl-5-hydroxy-6-metoxy-1,4-benzoquinol methylase
MTKPNSKNNPCIACDSTEFGEHSKLLVRCNNCGLVVAKEIPTFEELKKLYKEEYFFGMEYSDYKADRKALEANFKDRIKFLDKYISPEARVVEVGCAYGYFLNLLKDKVKWHQGFDVSTEGITYAKKELGVNASTSDFLDSDIKDGSIDLICMWDVMEHFGEPQKHVQKASKILKKGGALSFTTGDIDAKVAKMRGEKWRMIHPPTHIYYFNVKSAKKLLKKNGLKVVSVRHKGTNRNIGSVFNQLICNKKAKDKNPVILNTAYKIAQFIKLDKLNVPLNLYDVMEVTAIKE